MSVYVVLIGISFTRNNVFMIIYDVVNPYVKGRNKHVGCFHDLITLIGNRESL